LFGCIEVNRTAWECTEHCGYHLDVDSVISEFIQDGENVSDGERGNIVYTSLYNYAMPLIRYEVGDVGIPTDELCSCGRSLPLMKSVEGRCDDFIVLPSGNVVSPRVLSLLIKHTDGILEYQAIQKQINKLQIYIVPFGNVNDEKERELKASVGKLLNNEVSVEIIFTERIERGSTQKLRCFMSLLK